MLPKTNRLTKKKDFESVFRWGEAVKMDFLLFKIMKNQLPESRFGFVVSKKVSAKATERNRVKRRLRDAIFQKLDGLKKSWDVIVVALPASKNKEFLEIQTVVDAFLTKL